MSVSPMNQSATRPAMRIPPRLAVGQVYTSGHRRIEIVKLTPRRVHYAEGDQRVSWRSPFYFRAMLIGGDFWIEGS